MRSGYIKIPESIINISSNLLMEINKFGFVLFVSDKAKFVFDGIDKNKNLKNHFRSDDWIIVNKNIEIALYNQYSHHFYFEYKGRFYIVYAYPQDISVWLWFEDVTEKRHLSHLLNVCSQRSVFGEKITKSGYWELDLTKKRFYWSSGMYDLFEMSENDEKSHKNLIRELILPQDMPLYKNSLRKLLQNKENIGGFIRILTKKKQIKKCRFGAGVFYENGEEKIAGVFVDLSDCVNENEEKDAYLLKNFNCLLAKILHDFRQPLSAISLLVENVKDKDNSAKRLKGICDNLNLMINGILQFAKNDSKIVGEKFDLRQLLMRIWQEYYDKFNKKNIKVILNLNEFEICQNLFLSEKIIRNLIDNALKFTNSKILIKNIKNCFYIIDDGCGFDEINQKQIFRDFFQCNSLMYDKNEGVGLGLGIIKYSALLIGAEIKIKSRKNKYTMFKVCL